MAVREVLCSTAWWLRALMAAKVKRRRRQLELHASERNEAFYDHTEEPRSQYNTVVVFEWVATYPTTHLNRPSFGKFQYFTTLRILISMPARLFFSRKKISLHGPY